MNNTQPILQCTGLVREFKQGTTRIAVLDGVDFTVQAGEQVAIIGSSGSGKTTLLHLLAGLDTPTAGEVSVLGNPLSRLSDKMLCQLRNQHMGFVYQFHHLLPEFSALENVAMPLLIAKVSQQTALSKGC